MSYQFLSSTSSTEEQQQQGNNNNNGRCTKCRSLYEEMIVLKQQLVDAKTRIQQRSKSPERNRGGDASSSSGSLRVEATTRPRNTPYLPTEREERTDVKLNLLNSNPSTFPYRYVPPAEFLPAPFVEAHIDWLMILDRYAQLFHANHVAQPLITQDDPHVLNSTITLLQMKVKQQESQMEELQRKLEASEREKKEMMKTGKQPQQSISSPIASKQRGSHNNNSTRSPSGPGVQHNNSNLNPDFFQDTKGTTQPAVDVSGNGVMQMFGPNNNNTNANPRKTRRNSSSSKRVSSSYRNPDDDAGVADASSSDFDGEEENDLDDQNSYAAHRMARNEKIERYRQMKQQQQQQQTNSAVNNNNNRSQTPPAVTSSRQHSRTGSQIPVNNNNVNNNTNNSNKNVVAAPPGVGSNSRPSSQHASRSSSVTPKPTMAWNNIMDSKDDDKNKTTTTTASGTATRNASPAPTAPAPAQQQQQQQPQTTTSSSPTNDKTKPSTTETAPAAAALPDGWAERKDPASGKTYYYNKKTRETRWKRPTS